MSYDFTGPQWVNKPSSVLIFNEWSINRSADIFQQKIFHLNTIIPCIDGFVQERRNSIAKALELRLSCTNSSTSYLDSSLIHGQVVRSFNVSTEWFVVLDCTGASRNSIAEKKKLNTKTLAPKTPNPFWFYDQIYFDFMTNTNLWQLIMPCLGKNGWNSKDLQYVSSMCLFLF